MNVGFGSISTSLSHFLPMRQLSNVKDILAQAREVFIKNTPSGMNPSGY
jgi:hypothetical protein